MPRHTQRVLKPNIASLRILPRESLRHVRYIREYPPEFATGCRWNILDLYHFNRGAFTDQLRYVPHDLWRYGVGQAAVANQANNKSIKGSLVDLILAHVLQMGVDRMGERHAVNITACTHWNEVDSSTNDFGEDAIG